VLEIAGEVKVTATVADEPASILFTGMLNEGSAHGRDVVKASDTDAEMENPRKYYTAEVQKVTRRKIAKISCLVLIVHGDVNVINRINDHIIVPELKAAGKQVEHIVYKGEQHGFSMGSSTDEAALKFFEDSRRFLLPYLKNRPKPIAESKYKRVRVTKEREGRPSSRDRAQLAREAPRSLTVAAR
jgi:dienelactone hydrolase